MKKYITVLVVAVATASYTHAQLVLPILPSYAGDALRFSQTNYGSSARFKAMGNAQIGVGGDISSLGGNPAGLGLFTKSEFVFTPEFNVTKIDANYLNTNTTTNKSNLNLSQLGAVFHMPSYRAKGQDVQKGVVSASFAVGYNRNNDYNLDANFAGTNTKNSVYNIFNDYSVPPPNTQSVGISRSGSVSEFNLAGAINISNQIYIGANLGLVNLKYDYSSRLEEDGGTGLTEYYINYNQNQITEGSGLNGKLGIIFRPIQPLRIGVTLQTPTWFTLEDRYNVNSNDASVLGNETYDFAYNLSTPLKGSLGASYVFGKKGLLSADIDFVDYSSTRLSSSNGGDVSTIMEANNAIKSDYKSAVNYRIGGELRVNEFLSLRAGYGINGSAYKDDTDNYFRTQFYSGGIGYRYNNYFFDFTYQNVGTHSTFAPYLLKDFTEPVADSKNDKQNVFLTFGIRF